MSRSKSARLRAARGAVVAARATVVRQYLEGASLSALGTFYGCGGRWLSARFDEWGVPKRSPAEQIRLNNSGVRLPRRLSTGRLR
ncbi:hypothetical protein [Streptomyces palmae]|uniref:Uncharacterized protein n=1 Tax=Streptomyces palmae TaxID=1701085 RepID=A0A4Z0HHA1_9ACTN|nr:hypothetical protein [Streptomyces palmae]TGB16474.1 hypothetical protein E4099_05375 [Streptomyces palmae]